MVVQLFFLGCTHPAWKLEGREDALEQARHHDVEVLLDALLFRLFKGIDVFAKRLGRWRRQVSPLAENRPRNPNSREACSSRWVRRNPSGLLRSTEPTTSGEAVTRKRREAILKKNGLP